MDSLCRSQWPRGPRRRSAAARLLRSWVRIPPEASMFVCCECCVLSGRGLCDELITRPEESYRMWCVAVCDLETSRMGRPWPLLGRSATKKKKGLSVFWLLPYDVGVWLVDSYCHMTRTKRTLVSADIWHKMQSSFNKFHINCVNPVWSNLIV